MTIPASAPTKYSASRQLIAGSDINNLSDQLNSFQELTALAGGAKPGTQINAANVHATSATDLDSFSLPAGLFPGMSVFIANPTGHSIQVYGLGSDTINDVATATGVTQNSAVNANYVCVVARVGSNPAKWYRNLSA